MNYAGDLFSALKVRYRDESVTIFDTFRRVVFVKHRIAKVQHTPDSPAHAKVPLLVS